MREREPSIEIDRAACTGCVDCSKVCPTRAIRVREGRAAVIPGLCIDCDACIRTCRQHAARPRTSSPADLQRFRYTVALPSLTLYAQFGRDVDPGQVLRALTKLGFDASYDISWMCEMLAGATDAYLSECGGPWPKISTTCPAIVRLIQIRYPDMIANLLPIETARELAAKLLRRKLASERGLAPGEIGIFFVTPCTAIMNSILYPAGLEASYLDGALSIREVYPRLRRALGKPDGEEPSDPVSPRGLQWAMAGGEIAGMKNTNTMTVRGVEDVRHVFDHIEEGKFQAVDFLEAYICPDGCVSGELVVEGRYAAQRSLRQILRRLGSQPRVDEEKVRALLREHFFDVEAEVTARPVQPIVRNLREAVAQKREVEAVLARLPRRNCAACGAPDCATFAADVVRGRAALDECVFIRIERLERSNRLRREVLAGRKTEDD